jgi:hypothetical protein
MPPALSLPWRSSMSDGCRSIPLINEIIEADSLMMGQLRSHEKSREATEPGFHEAARRRDDRIDSRAAEQPHHLHFVLQLAAFSLLNLNFQNGISSPSISS